METAEGDCSTRGKFEDDDENEDDYEEGAAPLIPAFSPPRGEGD